MGGKPQPRQPFIGPLEEHTRMIPLTQGQYAKVYEEDYEWLMEEGSWFAEWDDHTKGFYAGRKVRREDGEWRNQSMHQLITGLRWKQVDHINWDTLDNRRSNLRDGKDNNSHRRIKTGGTSQYHGVCWYRWKSKWLAQIWDHGRHINLGYFDNELDAAIAYDAASLKYYGEYGTLNFP